MSRSDDDLNQLAPPERLLGYLNFSDGRPDHRFERLLDDALNAAGSPAALHAWLCRQADRLAATGNAAFRDLSQARRVLALTLLDLPAAYRRHHADLLAHQPDAVLFNGLFLARAAEAILACRSQSDDDAAVTQMVISRLNDYVGHRPVAVLETRSRHDLYPHERLRPIPLWIPEAGVAHGPYSRLIGHAIDIIQGLDDSITAQAYFDLDLLEELSFDPRAYDHNHPVNRRPNYLFGEWDPHRIDGHGFYRRFVVRQCILDAMIDRAGGVDHPNDALLFESAAVLAGTILMASGFSGSGPAAHDSESKLSTLTPQIARYRDRFYTYLIDRIPGEHGDRLREESKRLRQPFGGARQHLNFELARQRAGQIQERELALIYAEMGFPRAARERAARIQTPSARFLCEIRLKQTLAGNALRRREVEPAAAALPEIEDLLRRGIDCGAVVDPWNILGFNGLFPLFYAREDSIRDPRCDELIAVVDRQMELYAHMLAAAASAGQTTLGAALAERQESFAAWWDRYATAEVGDLPKVRAGERAESAARVAAALARWEGRSRAGHEGQVQSDLAFWRDQKEGFNSASAYAQVIEALLRHHDWRAGLTLLIAWLAEVPAIDLDDGSHAFTTLAGRWLDGILQDPTLADKRLLVDRFLELLEPNAEDLWRVPELDDPGTPPRESAGDYASAYDEMTFKDSADDGNEGALAGDAPVADDFPLEAREDEFEERFGFLMHVAKWWQAVARSPLWGDAPPEQIAEWRGTAEGWADDLRERMTQFHRLTIPAPRGGLEDAYQFDRRRNLRDTLIEAAISTWLEVRKAWRALSALEGAGPRGDEWEAQAIDLERAITAGDAAGVRERLRRFLPVFGKEPLLFVPLSENGPPEQILRARAALAMLEMLLDRLPRIGLIRETYHLIKLAKAMEQNGPQEGRKVSEFDRFFRIGLRAVVETLLDAASRWDADKSAPTDGFSDILRRIADSFLQLWIAHSQTLRLSVLEGVSNRGDWEQLRGFIQAHGRALFTTTFMQYANIRGILSRGISKWFEQQKQDEDSLLEGIFGAIEAGRFTRQRAEFWVELVLQSILEHHEEYRDYNSTTSHSDYGENLYVLLDFLRVKVNYDRYAWRMRPLVLSHEILCRKHYPEVAERWRESIAASSNKLAAEILEELAAREQEHSLKLRMIRDRVEERFVVPLELDRLCALIEPAVRAASEGHAEESPAFQALLEPLATFVDKPTGSGLDAPSWLRRVSAEVERARELIHRPPLVMPPARMMTFEELQQQLDTWETGL